MSAVTRRAYPSPWTLRLQPRSASARVRWLAAGATVVVAAVLFVALAGVRPAYDAYGWLTWGRQALHGNLNTNAAPSWKPLTFLFTLPFGLTGRVAPWLWMVTATAAAFAAPIPAARIVYRLAPVDVVGRYPAMIGAALAGLAVFGLRGYWHFVMIFTADPMIVTLCLAAIDCHLSGRPRAAFTLLALAALGRPEAWPFAVIYAAWAWRAVPSMRTQAIAGLLLIGALWFGVPALTSSSWFSAGNTALNASTPLHGDKLTGVIRNFLSLYETPMQLAALAALMLAVVRRDRTPLILAGAAVLWVAIWVGFALHGWEPDPRYMFEPAAVEVVLVGAAVARVLGFGRRGGLVRWASIAAVAALVVALVPAARIRLRLAHNGIRAGRLWTLQIDRLHNVIAQDGGPAHVLRCAPVVTTISYQSIVAWEIGENVADVGWAPGQALRARQSMVLFWPHLSGWVVRPYNVRSAGRAACTGLRRNSPFTYLRRHHGARRA
jgi:hypothetical protein